MTQPVITYPETSAGPVGPETGFDAGSDNGTDDEHDGRDRRVWLLAAAGALVVLGLAARFLLFSGGAAPATKTPFVPATGATTGQSATPAPVPSAAPAAPAVFNGAIGRADPFKPLYVAPAAPASSAGSGPAGTALPPPPTVGTTTTTGATTGNSGVPASGSGQLTGSSAAGSPATPVHITLAGVYHRGVTFGAQGSVDNKPFDVTVGTTFATRFKLVSVQDGYATFQYGDELFDLHPGMDVTKG